MMYSLHLKDKYMKGEIKETAQDMKIINDTMYITFACGDVTIVYSLN